MLTPGSTFASRYQIESELGRGGFAYVFLATDTSIGRQVAIKVLRPSPGGSDVHARFLREAKSVGQLGNPHTVTLLDFGNADGLAYAVFEYVEGRDLSRVVKEQGTLPEDVIVHIMLQVLESLEEAHGLGLLHRDIKPANIRVFTYDGDPWCVKLLDFGLARSMAAEASITATGDIVGTPRYMAPEQLRAQLLTPAADIYSLGMVAVELLLGPSSLTGSAWGDQLDRLMPGYTPEGLETVGTLGPILKRMTDQEVGRRFSSARAVRAALLGEPVPGSAHPTVREVVEQPASEGGGWSWLVALGVLLAMVAGAFALLNSHGSDEPAGRPPPPPTTEPRPTSIVKGAKTPDFGTPPPEPAAADCNEFVGDKQISMGLSGRVAGHVPHSDGETLRPLVVLLFAASANLDERLEASGFVGLADEKGFVVLAPAEFQLDEPDHPKMVNTANEQIGAARTWIERAIQANLCVDPDRVFVVGYELSGLIAELLACDSGVVAAAASHTFRALGTELDCKRAVPYIALQSKNSPPAPRKIERRRVPLGELNVARSAASGCRRLASLPPVAGTRCQDGVGCDFRFRSCDVPNDSPGAARLIWEFFENPHEKPEK